MWTLIDIAKMISRKFDELIERLDRIEELLKKHNSEK
jgi:hypothetical protein